METNTSDSRLIGKTTAIHMLYPEVAYTADGVAYDENDNVVQLSSTFDADWAMLELRERRDRMLGHTDWWVMPDRTPTQAQLDYRQALRDITNSYSSLDDVVWPTKPE